MPPQVLTTDASIFGDVLNIDYVECSVRSIRQPGAIHRPFHDPSVYSLTLTVHLPTPTSVRLLPHITSPPVILDTYTREDYEVEAPDWVSQLDSSARHFWQPRAHIVELVASLSLTADNVHGAHRLIRWCTALMSRMRILSHLGLLPVTVPLRSILVDTPSTRSHLDFAIL
ncbi:hypothetical protein EV421DRAFT_1911300 [Armillaria borealis]|uniref:Uncharacterized protein n=1 Tax=Armillaria borealis TaxID=47425 RepID=A0AA39MFN0_9AGAR|nr:hypothetical protein EV421DRAFT_1911300 [Armillaria borealis]